MHINKRNALLALLGIEFVFSKVNYVNNGHVIRGAPLIPWQNPVCIDSDGGKSIWSLFWTFQDERKLEREGFFFCQKHGVGGSPPGRTARPYNKFQKNVVFMILQKWVLRNEPLPIHHIGFEICSYHILVLRIKKRFGTNFWCIWNIIEAFVIIWKRQRFFFAKSSILGFRHQIFPISFSVKCA